MRFDGARTMSIKLRRSFMTPVFERAGMLKTLAALAVAAALGFLSPAVQAHEGHDHPAKTKKEKKIKPPKKTGDETRFVVGRIAS
jgi:hypothetical protein